LVGNDNKNTGYSHFKDLSAKACKYRSLRGYRRQIKANEGHARAIRHSQNEKLCRAARRQSSFYTYIV